MEIERIQDPALIEREILSLKDTFSDLIEHVDIGEYSRKIAEHANVYLLKKDVTCGLEAIYINDRESRIAYVTLFGIAEEYRRKHLGTMLFHYCIREAVAGGMRKLRLEVKKDNDTALQFYFREGMEILEDHAGGRFCMEKSIAGQGIMPSEETEEFK